MASQGNYDHPSYLTRQQISMGLSTAGANGLQTGKSFVSDMRLRKASVTPKVAGTSAAGGNAAIVLCIGTCMTGFSTGVGFTLTTSTGTTSIGTIALGSSAANTVTTSSDFDVRIQAGSVVLLKNGTDATGTYDLVFEGYLDPGATWTSGP